MYRHSEFDACNTFQNSWDRDMYTTIIDHIFSASVCELRTLTVEVLTVKFFPILA